MLAGERRCCPDAPQRGKPPKARSAAAEDTKSEVKLGEYKGIARHRGKPAGRDRRRGGADGPGLCGQLHSQSGQITDRGSGPGRYGQRGLHRAIWMMKKFPDSSVEDYNMLIGSGIFFNGAESESGRRHAGRNGGYFRDLSGRLSPGGSGGKELPCIRLTVNYIVQEEQAQLTDEFVASISDCETVDEYRQMIRDNLEASRENEREMNRRNAVWDQVLENAQVISYSQADIDAIVQEYTSYDTAAAQDFGISLEEYVQTYQDMTMDEYNTAVEDLAKDEIKNELVIDAIAQAENITGADMTDQEMERCAQEQGYESVDDYKNDKDQAAMEEDAKGLRVIDFVVSEAQITEN